MMLNKNSAVYAMVVCISALQTSCTLYNPKAVSASTGATAVAVQPSVCGDPLDYYYTLSAQANDEPSIAETSLLPADDGADACLKLRQAIELSMPGSKQQNDEKALVILKDLKRAGVLSDSDLQFNNMLLQHVSQRQDLRQMFDVQEKRLIKTETQNAVLRLQLETLKTQLDQLKNIEVEIDKKERSVTSPIGE